MRAHCVFIFLLLLLVPAACGPRDATPPSVASGGAGRGGMAGTAGGGDDGSGGDGGGVSCGPGVASATGGMMNVGAGTGGTIAGSGGGMSGAGGTATGGSIAAGVLYPCPDPPPSVGDACPNESVTCTYPGKKSCACYNKTWNCADCPTCQPATTTSCSIPFRLSLSCNYGNVTCSCERRSGPDGLWRCGVCPTAEPLTGDLCGNVPAGNCRYGADTCSCGTDGKWSCATAACPPNFIASRSPCTSPHSAYTCRYPDQDQDCICLPNSDGAVSVLCSCPADPPADGALCIARDVPCTYGDISCTCLGSWRCASTTPPNPCPLSQPGAGEACGIRVSTCAYGAVICACDGTSWSCS